MSASPNDPAIDTHADAPFKRNSNSDYPDPTARKKPIDLEAVVKAANDLIEKKERVSVRNVRLSIGRGSHRDIRRFLTDAKQFGLVPTDYTGLSTACLRQKFLIAMNYIGQAKRWYAVEVASGRMPHGFPEPPASLILSLPDEQRPTEASACGGNGNVTSFGNVTNEEPSEPVVIIDDESDPVNRSLESPEEGTLLGCTPKSQVIAVSDCASMDTPAAESSRKDAPPGIPSSDAFRGTPRIPPCNADEIRSDDIGVVP